MSVLPYDYPVRLRGKSRPPSPWSFPHCLPMGCSRRRGPVSSDSVILSALGNGVLSIHWHLVHINMFFFFPLEEYDFVSKPFATLIKIVCSLPCLLQITVSALKNGMHRKSEGKLSDSVLTFYLMDRRSQTQVIRLGGKLLYLGNSSFWFPASYFIVGDLKTSSLAPLPTQRQVNWGIRKECELEAL